MIYHSLCSTNEAVHLSGRNNSELRSEPNELRSRFRCRWGFLELLSLYTTLIVDQEFSFISR